MLYEGIIVDDGEGFFAAILKLNPNEPGCDVVKEYRKAKSQEEAEIWLDDEMSRLVSGKGVWDV
jgi:hypothetical protein